MERHHPRKIQGIGSVRLRRRGVQRAQAGDAPVLIRIETKAGHGAGTPTSKRIDKVADLWAFLVENLDMTLPSGSN